jgi:hypothetical protein
MSIKAGESLYKSSNNKFKEILQKGEHIPIEDKFSKDYRKERAIIYSKNLDEQIKMIKYQGEKRKEIDDYWNMNNKLIERTFIKKYNINNNNRPPRDIKNVMNGTKNKLQEKEESNMKKIANYSFNEYNNNNNNINKGNIYKDKIDNKIVISDKIKIENDNRIFRSRSSIERISGRK